MDIGLIKTSLLGQLAWLPRNGVGTFITIEFGNPVLLTREPLLKPDVHPRLARRRVVVQGERHLWVQASDWTLQSEAWTLTSSDDVMMRSQRLEILAGQILLDLTVRPDASEFRFEYGEVLTVRPEPDPAEALWSLFWHEAGNASLLGDGTVSIEP